MELMQISPCGSITSLLLTIQVNYLHLSTAWAGRLRLDFNALLFKKKKLYRIYSLSLSIMADRNKKICASNLRCKTENGTKGTDFRKYITRKDWTWPINGCFGSWLFLVHFKFPFCHFFFFFWVGVGGGELSLTLDWMRRWQAWPAVSSQGCCVQRRQEAALAGCEAKPLQLLWLFLSPPPSSPGAVWPRCLCLIQLSW